MPRRPAVTLLIPALLLMGCASNVTPPEDRAATDPWEPMNRSLYKFNTVLDNATFKPVAKGYKAVIPAFARRGVTNFSRNLGGPRSIINNLLQGKVHNSASEFGRFVINSTFGIGGLIDVTGMGGLPEHEEDFGQTFAVWGIPQGPYLMVPIFGPMTVSDAAAFPFDLQSDPLFTFGEASLRDPINILRLINLRAKLLAAEDFLDDSADPYITLRESYLQNREFRIYDGDPPFDEDFYDDMYDDMEDVDE
jgi:phospholipid-binding lipoprotein MlaA